MSKKCSKLLDGYKVLDSWLVRLDLDLTLQENQDNLLLSHLPYIPVVTATEFLYWN